MSLAAVRVTFSSAWALCVVGLVLLLYTDLRASWVFEDTLWLTAYANTEPALFQARGLAEWTWWVQEVNGQPYLAFRAVNVALHLLNGWLLWTLGRRLGLASGVAFGMTALWLLHPLQVQTVAYAAQRTELIAAFGVLGACVAVTRQTWRWPLAACAIAIGYGGKETALIACALIPLVLWCLEEPWELPARVGGAVLSVPIIAVGPRAFANAELYSTSVTWYEWAVKQGASVYALLSQAAIPMSLAPDADIDAWSSVYGYVGIGLLVAFVLMAWRLRDIRPLVAVGLFWCVVSVAPRFVVQTPRSYLNAHQAYVPIMGLFLAGAGMVKREALP